MSDSKVPAEPGWWWIDGMDGSDPIPANIYRRGEDLFIRGYPFSMRVDAINERWFLAPVTPPPKRETDG